MLRNWLTSVQQRMARHPAASALLCFAVANVISHFVSRVSFAWPSVVHSPPPPRRFFPRSSVVLDFPYGDLASITSLVEEGEDEWLFTMYYAPWCGHSMAARSEFDKAARYLDNEVRFIAVNCWYANGSCRQNNNFQKFPAFYMHHISMKGVKYNGVASAEYIVQFIQMILSPLNRLNSHADVLNFISSADSTVIGCFDFAAFNTSSCYKQFYYAAIRTIEREPRNVIPFGVVTDQKLAVDVGLDTTTSTITMIRAPNDSVKYPQQLNFTSSSMVQWIFAHRQQTTLKWLLPSGTKSLSLSTELRRGPAVIAFIEARPLSHVNTHLSTLREIASVYINCNRTLIVGDSLVRLRLAAKQRSLLARCDVVDRKKVSKLAPLPIDRRCCLSIGHCDACIHYLLEHPRSVHACELVQVSNIVEPTASEPRPIGFDFRGCIESANNYNTAEFISRCCATDNSSLLNRTISTGPFTARYLTEMLSIVSSEPRDDAMAGKDVLHRFSTDPFVASEGLGNLCRQVRRFRIATAAETRRGDEVQLQANDLQYDAEFAGLGCRTNKTVRFYAMDRRVVYTSAFEDSLLGFSDVVSRLSVIDGSVPLTRPAVVIVDVKDETVYAMSGKFSHKNLAEFVMNFTSGSLASFHRGAAVTPVESNVSATTEEPNGDELVHVIDVTASNFYAIVMNHKKDVLLFYYASFCGFCSSFAHIYLSLAYHFSNTQSIVFARINADTNDLPWEFQVDQYPALVYYPAVNKADSVTYPPHLALTLPNLLRFMRRAAGPSSEIGACSHECIRANIRSTVTAIRRLTKRRDRLHSAVDAVRHRLGDMFNISQHSHARFADVPSYKSVPIVMKNMDDTAPPISSRLEPGKNFVITAAGDFQVVFTGSDYCPRYGNSMKSDPSHNNHHETAARHSCSGIAILRMRDELAILRRHLYRTEEHLFMLRSIYSLVLIPASSCHSTFLERRRWMRIRKFRMLFAARFRNYYDHVSGCEWGLYYGSSAD